MEASKPGERRAIRWKPDGIPPARFRRKEMALLVVDPVELLDHLIRQVERILGVDHDFGGLLAAFIDAGGEASLLGNGLRRGGNAFHVVVHEFLLLAL